MTGLDRRWIEMQLHHADLDPTSEQAVLTLLDALNGCELPDDRVERVVQAFEQLVRRRPIAAPPVRGPGAWTAASPGQLKPGDRVRVRQGSFEGALGDIHNGREGVVVEVGDGDVVMRATDDRRPAGITAHYSPHVLETWIASAAGG